MMASFSEAAPASRLRAILINDGQNSPVRGADLSKGCQSNIFGIRMILSRVFETHTDEASAPDFELDPQEGEKNLERQRYSLNVLEGNEVSPHKIREFLKNFQVLPDENIFVYYCGHGGTDPQRGGDFFAIGSEGNILRSEIRSLLLGKQLRGIVLLSDACTTLDRFDFFPEAPGGEFEAFTDLFLELRGVVDIASSSSGEASWFTEQGSVFTTSFLKLMGSDRVTHDANRDGVLGWNEVFPQLRSETNEMFIRLRSQTPDDSPMRKQNSQFPSAFFLGEWPHYSQFISVDNLLGEKIELSLEYYVQNSATSTWEWNSALTYTLPANAKGPLEQTAGKLLLANSVRWTAKGLESGRQYPGSTVQVISPQQGPVLADNEKSVFILQLSQ